jgi:hypothetical protein
VILASSDLCPPSVKPRSGGFDGVGDRGHSRAVEFPALPEQRDVEMVIGDLGQCRINELVREHPPTQPFTNSSTQSLGGWHVVCRSDNVLAKTARTN